MPLCHPPSIFAPLLLLAAAGILQAQQPVVGQLTRVEEVISLSAEDAGKNPRAVRLSGTVVDANRDPRTFSIHDGSHTVGVSFPSAVTLPALGDTVELIGHTFTHTVSGFQHPRVQAQSLRITGKGALPPMPPLMPAIEVNTFRHFDQWVRVEGHVVRWKFRVTDNELVIVIVDGTDMTTVAVRTPGRESVPAGLMNAKIRLTGLNYGKNSHSAYGSIMVPSLQQMEILTPGSEDAYALPTTRLEGIATRRTPPGSRVKVRGVVLATSGETVIYMRDGPHALSCILFPPWGNNLVFEEYHDGGPWPAVKPGDEIELLGSIMDTAQNPDMRGFSLIFCYARVIGSQSAPAPVQTRLRDIAAGRHSFDLVQLRARLLSITQIPVSNTSWRTTMMLEADGKQLPLTHQATGFTNFDTARVDDELLITALADEANARDPRQLWLLSSGDIKSLGVSPVVRTRQIWLYGGSASGVLALLASWIIILRRSNQQKTRIAAELKAAGDLLEHRVAERTTELQQAHEELNAALAQERELGELKSRFVTMVSHEFRTPLGVTMSAVEIMRQFDERLSPEKRRELCDEIYTSTCNMAGLMEQVLLLGRVEAGKLGFKPASIDLEDILRRLIDETQSVTHRKCPILLQIEGDLSMAKGDEALLRHIFTNLISNGVKYSPEARPVEVRVRREDVDAVIEIADHGIGIPESDLLKLFEAFHRGGNVGHIPGTGLGMTIVKRCVELHCGLITVKSEVGRGTTFTVRLPVFESSHPITRKPA